MKVSNIEREIIHIFWASWGISMEFSEKDVTYDNIKSHKKQRFTISLEDIFLEKPQGC